MTIIRYAQTYNMTFASEPPHELQVQFQRRSPAGDNSNYNIFKLHYPRPNAIRLRLNGAIKDPILLTDVNNTASAPHKDLNVSECGSYIYFYTNYTIHFVVTEAAGCTVTVELTESVQLTTHFQMDINDFFNNNNSVTNFINNLCALLNIVDTSRVKVVGVVSGSTTVIAAVTPSTSNSSDPTVMQITSNFTVAASSGALGSSMASIGPVIGASAIYQPMTDDEESDESSKTGLIVGCAVAGVVLIAVTIVTTISCLRRRAKVVEEIITH